MATQQGAPSRPWFRLATMVRPPTPPPDQPPPPPPPAARPAFIRPAFSQTFRAPPAVPPPQTIATPPTVSPPRPTATSSPAKGVTPPTSPPPPPPPAARAIPPSPPSPKVTSSSTSCTSERFGREEGKGSEEIKAAVDATIKELKHLPIFHRRRTVLNLDAFFRYLDSGWNSPLPLIVPKVMHDMEDPLARYFIFTGHNSYLTGNQISSDSSIVPIIESLKQGVRVIELDMWPNSAKYDIDIVASPQPSSACFSRSKQSLSDDALIGGRDRCVNWGCFLPLSSVNLTHLLHEEFKNFHRETERKIRGRSESSWTEPTNHAGERAAGSRKQSPVPKTADHADLRQQPQRRPAISRSQQMNFRCRFQPSRLSGTHLNPYYLSPLSICHLKSRRRNQPRSRDLTASSDFVYFVFGFHTTDFDSSYNELIQL
ncbi:hypothetical protein LXL04_000057 [Taraxacum kok-saghyz]